MKNTYRTILFLLTGLVMLAGCTQKELNLPAEGESSVTDGRSEWVSLRMEGKEDSKVSVNDAGAVAWTTGDQIAVHTDAGAYRTFPVDPYYSRVLVNLSDGEARNGYAVYPETAVVNNSAETVQVRYPDSYDLSGYSEEALATLTEARMPMVAANTPGAALNFYHVGGILRITALNVPKNTKTLVVTVTGGSITGTASVSNPGTATATSSITSGGNVVTITLPGSGLTSDFSLVVLNIPVPTHNDVTPLTLTQYQITAKNSSGTVLDTSYKLVASSSLSHASGSKLTCGFPAPFSVAADEKVFFSPGNLVASTYNLGTTWTWSFHANQWDSIRNGTANDSINGAMTVSTNGAVDLFGWVGASAPAASRDCYGIYNSTDDSDYGNTPAEPLAHDWGEKANEANLGGHNNWFTLSKEQWQYLIQERADHDSKYGYAMIKITKSNKFYGLILLPDTFIDPNRNKGSDAFVPGKSGGNNTYGINDWYAMEAAGAIFLPNILYREGNEFEDSLIFGRYWSSTADNDTDGAYFLGFFGDNYIMPDSDQYRHIGQAVRLVRDIY